MMTTGEAIDIIKCLAWHTRPDEEDVEQAIKALEQEPCDMKQRVEKEYLYESLCEDLKKANVEIKRLSEPFEDAISRQAVDELSKELVHTTRDKADFLCNFWEGLQKLPPVTPKQQTYEDAISRQEVLDIIMPYCKDDDGSVENTGDLRNALDDIESLPPVTPKEKTGKWIKTQSGDGMFPEIIVCSKCNNENSHLDFNEHSEPIGKVFIKSKYCPNCGARMEVSVR